MYAIIIKGTRMNNDHVGLPSLRSLSNAIAPPNKRDNQSVAPVSKIFPPVNGTMPATYIPDGINIVMIPKSIALHTEVFCIPMITGINTKNDSVGIKKENRARIPLNNANVIGEKINEAAIPKRDNASVCVMYLIFIVCLAVLFRRVDEAFNEKTQE